MALITQIGNPILWQESTHQDRGMKHWRKRWRWIGYVIVMLLIGLVASTLNDIQYGTRETATFVIWTIHICACLFSIVAGANVISREHVGATWDALVLTGVSARSILWGKWRAALRRAGGWLLLLGITRLAMLPIYSYALLNRFAYWTSYGTNSSRFNDPDARFEIELIAWAALLSVVMTVVLTVLEVLACTALGMAASALTKRGAFAIVVASIIRFAPVAIFAGFTFYELRDAPYRAYRWWRFTPFALADGGTSPLYMLALPAVNWTRGRHMEALPGLLLASGMLTIILIVSLLVAWWCIRRSGALAEMKSKKVVVEQSA